MVAIRVQYTVQPEYAAQNRINIEKVMARLKANPIKGMLYSTYTLNDDENTFVHINICQDEATIAQLSQVPEFLAFRKALKASAPIVPPSQTKMSLAAAGFELE